MPFTPLREKYDEAKRLTEIMSVFFRYGLEDLFDRSRLGRNLKQSWPVRSAKTKGRNDPATTPARLRAAFEELGPAFIKLGQFLSTRPDIVSPAFTKELAKLQDDVPPAPFRAIRAQIKESLGAPLERHFREFSAKPLASASIAQVHLARLTGGTKVAVKVRRPGIAETVEADSRILLKLASFLKDKGLVAEIWRPVEVAEEFERSLKEELDFQAEAANQERFAADFAEVPEVKIPRVLGEHSGDGVIAMEYLEGVKMKTVLASRGRRYPKKKIAAIGADAIFRQIFRDSFFHGDLHPGNLLWLEKEGRLAFMDFGIVGRLRPDETKALVLILDSILSDNPDKAVIALQGLGLLSPDCRTEALASAIGDLISKYQRATLKEVRVAAIVQELFGVMSSFQIRLPASLVGLAKTLVSIEDLASSLDPDFDIFGSVEPYIKEAARRQADPAALGRRLENGLWQSESLLEKMPEDLWRIAEKVRREGLPITVNQAEGPAAIKELARTGRRLSASLIIAGLVVGSSFIMPTFPTIGLTGYILASIIGLFVLGSIFGDHFSKKD